jgi:hypothetical protein
MESGECGFTVYIANTFITLLAGNRSSLDSAIQDCVSGLQSEQITNDMILSRVGHSGCSNDTFRVIPDIFDDDASLVARLLID